MKPIKGFQIENLGHTGYLAGCLREAAVDDHIIILYVNTSGSRLVQPYGGIGKLMSTSVIATMVPGGYIFDMSTTSTSENAARRHLLNNTKLDVDLVLEDGSFTRDPKDLYAETSHGGNPLLSKTAIRFNDHKLFNLAIITEILSGLVTGSGTSQGEDHRSGC